MSERAVFSLARGERLDACQDGCLKFWIVEKGWAAICTSFADGRRQITGLETGGDTICGLVATPDAPSWLEALDDCVICQLDFSRAARDLQGNPKFMMEVFRLTHQRLENVSIHLSTLGRLDSTERVILFLGQMALRFRPTLDGIVRLPTSREDIADYLGLNAETVSRILTRLKKQRLVKFLSPTEYTIPDMAALERRLPVPIDVVGHEPRMDRFVAGQEFALKEMGA
ncbi:MAG: Crp/Fnr family transcriptional regulator [Rhodobacteraceae bacterium]|nr:Crp/Fnr family transcriptional regulator [Paracoccaceae bacterium]